MALFGIIFVGEIEQKQAIWCLKCKSLNINFLFIELLYKINITFVIMLTFGVCSTGGFSHLSELWSKQQFYWNCTFILCQQVSRLEKITVFPVRAVHKSAQDRTLNVQRSCFITFWSVIFTFSHIAILVFPSPNLRPLEIIIKTFLYNLRLKALVIWYN